MKEYVEDIRALKRTKSESKADWLVWRKGRFSPNEVQAIQSGLESWVDEICEEKNISRDEALESLKWAKENGMKAWCDIATRSSLPERKIGSIRHCVLRRMLGGSELSKWSKEQTAEFLRLQGVYGARAWKQIAKETGRTLEDVTNKGRQIEQVLSKKSEKKVSRFGKAETLRVKLAQLVKDELEAIPSYEYTAIRSDCILVALVRRYVCSSERGLESIHGLPISKISKKLNTTPLQVRHRWHHCVMPEIVKRATLKLQDGDKMDKFLLLQARRACKGLLTDSFGIQLFASYDWNGLPWQLLMPLWPQGVTESRLQNLLRREPKFGLSPLPQVVKTAVKSVLANEKKSDIHSFAETHFEEITRLFNLVADRGDAFIKEGGIIS
jgi:hypothetical protein